MKSRQIFQKAGNVLDLSRNYYLLNDGTFLEFPVQVIALPRPLPSSSMPPHSTQSAPPKSTTSLPPKSTTSCHSQPATTPPLSPQQATSTAANISAPSSPSLEITGETNIPKTAKGKPNTLRPKTRKQKKDAIHGDRRTTRCMEQVIELQKQGIHREENNKKKRGRPPRMHKNVAKRELEDQHAISEEKGAGHEEKQKKKRGRPPGVTKNPKKRELEDVDTTSKESKKNKGGWLLGKPRNPEKRKLWEQDQIMKNHHEAGENSQTKKKSCRNDGLPTPTKPAKKIAAEKSPRGNPKGTKRKPLQAKFSWRRSSTTASAPAEEETATNTANHMGPDGPPDDLATISQRLHSNNIMTAGIRDLLIEQVNQTKQMLKLLTGLKDIFEGCNGIEILKEVQPTVP